jgi:hypothetical protein
MQNPGYMEMEMRPLNTKQKNILLKFCLNPFASAVQVWEKSTIIQAPGSIQGFCWIRIKTIGDYRYSTVQVNKLDPGFGKVNWKIFRMF